MPDAMPERPSLLPAPLRRPLWLIGTMLVPQLVLLLLNFRSWWLVAGEMTTDQSATAYSLGIMQALFCIAGLGAALSMAQRRLRLDWPHGIALLLGHAAFLWIFTAQLENVVPRDIPDWMLPRGTLLYHQFALVMPALLHGALLVACFGTRGFRWRDVGGSAALAVGIPVLAYLFINVLGNWNIFPGAPVPLIIFFFVSLTALMVMALLRLMMLAGRAIERAGGNGRLVVLAVVGIVGPIGGLVLNAKIPFPSDFQSSGVYAMALLNGIALLLPVDGPRLTHRLTWLAQCILFAFTTYFMLVFLPFLPLALLAIIAMGSGLLMLVPLTLFVLHAQQLTSGVRAIRAGTRPLAWLAAGLAALFVLPAGFALRARQDRAALETALAHAYSPDYEGGRFDGNIKALQRGLENLRDFKAGLQLPFLSEFYNDVVFGGLVLPDEKLRHLYLTYFGRSLPDADPGRFGADLFGTGRRRSMWGGWGSTPPPTNTVDLVSLETVRATEGDCETATAKLVIHNRGSAMAEYVTRLKLPPGVFLSGYWLHIGKERVPGRLFEKKAALWVYESIRDLTRRDPGILLYKQPDEVELRVFPLNAGETRTTEIELIWPLGLEPPIRIADRNIDTFAAVKSPAYMMADAGDSGRLLVMSPPRLREAGATAVPDPPYLHVILDASADSDPKALASRVQELSKHSPGFREVVVSAANFEFETPQDRPLPMEAVEAQAHALRLPARGGFCRDRALKCAMAWNEKHASGRPVVLAVILGKGPRAILPDEDLAYFAHWYPHVAGYLELGATGGVQEFDFRRQSAKVVGNALTELKAAGQTVFAPLGRIEPVAYALPAGPAGEHALTNARYLKAAAAFLRYAHWIKRPAGREEERTRIVEASRAANVLTPLTSFIVVENSAQWRLLEQKEKQKLKRADALEIQKAPEPSTWLLAGGLAAWAWWRRRSPQKRGLA